MATTFLKACLTAACLAAGVLSAHAAAVIEIQLWHGMPGELAYQFDKLVADFNASQGDYRIVPVSKGLYSQTMLAALFALRLREHPAIVQVAEVGTATMMAAKSAIVPVHELMRDEQVPFDPTAFIPAVAGYYTDDHGHMLSLPFNSSVPILYYNKNQFRAARIDAAQPPATWPEVEAMASRLLAAGHSCGFTTDWPSWINVENFSALHGQPIATNANGFDGLDAELAIDNPVMTRHLATLTEWQKSRIYVYGGRTTRAEAKFLNRECGIFLGSSASRAEMLTNANFEVGFGMLPYWPDIAGAPRHPVLGGGSLWVLRDRPGPEYAGVARFFAYLSRADVQAKWHQATGYLPITQAAYELTRQQGYYDRNAGADISIRQITLHPPTREARGLRLGSYVAIREIIEDEMEQALNGKKPATAALQAAVVRGNAVLREFAATNR